MHEDDNARQSYVSVKNGSAITSVSPSGRGSKEYFVFCMDHNI
jgi:hypothetical protein